jgi:oxygen-dependent protoporphyrinogen oxidase
MRITIIGGGISGLTLGFALLQRQPDLDLKVFEAENREGGKIRTVKTEGFLCEASVNGFLNNKPETLELSSKLSLNPLKSNDNSRKRYILTGNQLQLIPDNPKTFFTSKFLSISGRLRVIFELFMPKGDADDESLESFALRRVGREFFEKLLDPMASGIYAGDPSKMSIRSCFSKVFDIERKYGSLIKGFIAISKEAKKASAGPSGILHSFSNGMISLIDALKNGLSERIVTGKEASSIEKRADFYEIFFHDGTVHESDIVVCAVPAHNAAGMFSEVDKTIAGILETIPYPPVTVVAIGLPINKIGADMDSFGFLIPAKERRNILGTLFDSSIFPDRAPHGKALLRTFVGGARKPDLALLDDEKLINMVIRELSDILKITADPVFVRIFRWQKAIPQYLIGHHEKLKKLDEQLQKHKGLYLTGNAYRGVSVNDCIANNLALAEKIVADI